MNVEPTRSDPSTIPALRVRDISVEYGTRCVLDSVNLDIARGEVVGLIGPSGSGKSTLLRVIAGLIAADTGTIELDGIDVGAVPTHQRSVGMVFQDEQLFPHLDVAGNIEFGLRMAGVSRPERQSVIDHLLKLVSLDGFDGRSIRRLSGGEAKRVALARSLAPEPAVLLMDEPLTGLDAELRDRLAVELAAVIRSTNTTAIWVTHDIAEAEAVGDRVVRLADLSRPA